MMNEDPRGSEILLIVLSSEWTNPKTFVVKPFC